MELVDQVVLAVQIEQATPPVLVAVAAEAAVVPLWRSMAVDPAVWAAAEAAGAVCRLQGRAARADCRSS